jgi:hypothetical protein
VWVDVMDTQVPKKKRKKKKKKKKEGSVGQRVGRQQSKGMDDVGKRKKFQSDDELGQLLRSPANGVAAVLLIEFCCCVSYFIFTVS